MRALLWVVLTAAGLWAGYWVLGSGAVQRGAERWFAAAAAQGVQAQNGGLRVAGFPNRFDLTVTAPRILDAASGYGWHGDDLRLLAMTWKPWHLIALAPPTQVITTPLGDFTLTASDLRGSVRLHPTSDLALRSTVIEATDLAVSGPLGRVTLAKASFATAEDTSRRHGHRIGLRITELTPDPAFAATLPDLPAQMAALHLDATLLLSAPLDRHFDETRPEVTGMILDDARLDWGPLQLTASGSLATIPGGYAEGRLDLHIENWRRLPAVLGQIGLMDPVVAPTLLRAMEVMARESTDPDVLDVPLTFKSGLVRFGFLPIGPAPRLGQRQ